MYKDGMVSKLLLLQRSLCFRIDGHAHPEQQHRRNVWYGGVTNYDRLRHKQLAAGYRRHAKRTYMVSPTAAVVRQVCIVVVYPCCLLSVICNFTQTALPAAAAVG